MTDVPSAPALGISFSVNVPGDRNLVFQTHVERDTSVPALNALLDRACTAADRLVARYTLPILKDQLAVEQDQLVRMGEDLKRMDELHHTRAAEHGKNRRGAYVIPEKEAQQRVGVLTTAEAFKKRIAKLQAQIAECQGKVDGTDVRTDR